MDVSAFSVSIQIGWFPLLFKKKKKKSAFEISGLTVLPGDFRYKNSESSWAKVILSPLLVQELFEVTQLSLMTNWYNFILFLAQVLTRLTQHCLQDQSG